MSDSDIKGPSELISELSHVERQLVSEILSIEKEYDYLIDLKPNSREFKEIVERIYKSILKEAEK